MKKTIVLLGAILLFWSCAIQGVQQTSSSPGDSRDAPPPSDTAREAPPPPETSRQAPSSRATAPQAPPVQNATFGQGSPAPDSLLFAGRTIEEVYVAAKIALADCRYAIKSSDPGGGLLIATRAANLAGEQNPPVATVLVFTDPAGAPGVKVQIVRPGQAGDPSGAIRAETEQILAAIQDLLK